ncbi:hypothetical protein GCM10027044_33660 [Hymenobacter ruber]
MSEEKPTAEFVHKLVDDAPDNIKSAAKFIAQTITPSNVLLTPEYLNLPSDSTLKEIYYIAQLSFTYNGNEARIEEVRRQQFTRNILIGKYYALLFTAVGNKNKPFNLAAYNFIPDSYGLNNNTEKAIFFLQCMNVCGKTIWGYMHLQPTRTKLALATIQKYPKFNGAAYYRYTDLDFTDFPIYISGESGPQSYKFYYTNTYYDVLLSHYACLHAENASKESIRQIVTGSIMSNTSLFKYSSKQAQLNSIVQEY